MTICPDFVVLLVATSPSTRHALNGYAWVFKSATTGTAVVDKPAKEDEDAGHHGRAH
jgi:hypothetical protein